MRILISNDDGYEAKGIKQLTKSLSEVAEVIVVAPNKNKSAASSSLTLGKPLKPIPIDKNIYAIDAFGANFTYEDNWIRSDFCKCCKAGGRIIYGDWYGSFRNT